MAEETQKVELNKNSIQWSDARFEEDLDKRTCKEYLSYRNYLLQSPVVDEESFPIAYSIVVHRDAHQVERMIRAIYRPQNHYCIHVDAKSSQMYKLMQKYVKCFDNVFLIDDRTDVIYADYTRLEADIKCMKALLPRKWNYLINLCGMDFPLKTNYQMVNYLRGLYPHQSAESFPLARGSGKSLRFEYSWISDSAKEKPSEDEYPLENIPNGAFWRSNVKNKMESYPLGQDAVLFGGSGKQIQSLVNYLPFSAYNIFSRDFINFTCTHPVVESIFKWSRDTYSPEEYVWATLVRQDFAPGSRPKSGKFDVNEIQSRARLVKWSDYAGVQYPYCDGYWRHSICVYGYGDVGWLMKREHLFANKFDTNHPKSNAAVQCLEARDCHFLICSYLRSFNF